MEIEGGSGQCSATWSRAFAIAWVLADLGHALNASPSTPYGMYVEPACSYSMLRPEPDIGHFPLSLSAFFLRDWASHCTWRPLHPFYSAGLDGWQPQGFSGLHSKCSPYPCHLFLICVPFCPASNPAILNLRVCILAQGSPKKLSEHTDTVHNSIKITVMK